MPTRSEMAYDCIIIGGGVVGSSAAYHMARRGKKTLLLEQFPLPHTRGSSHGATRILRSSYDKPLYSHLTVEALQLWYQLERETNTKLFKQTGFLVCEKAPFENYRKSLQSVRDSGGVGLELSADEIRRRYSPLLRLPPEFKAYHENNSGTLRADKALTCLREQIQKFGGCIHDEEKVQHIFPGTIVTVRTNKGTYKTKHLIVTPGAWISQLLKPLGLNLPFQTERISVCYWKEKVPGSTLKMPAFLDYSTLAYGLPSDEYAGMMKIDLHGGTTIPNPDYRDEVSDEASIKVLCKYVQDHFPGLVDKPSIIEPCMYTVTPDGDFVVDTLPHHPNIAIGAGFSGHGFKMAPVIGRILGELALGETPSYDITMLRMNRFKESSVSSNL